LAAGYECFGKTEFTVKSDEIVWYFNELTFINGSHHSKVK